MAIGKRISSPVILIVTIIVLLQLFAGLFPEVRDSGNELNATGVPLGDLFVGTGVVALLIATGIFLTIVNNLLLKREGKK